MGLVGTNSPAAAWAGPSTGHGVNSAGKPGHPELGAWRDGSARCAGRRAHAVAGHQRAGLGPSGDCVAPRLVRSNIMEAYLLGREI